MRAKPTRGRAPGSKLSVVVAIAVPVALAGSLVLAFAPGSEDDDPRPATTTTTKAPLASPEVKAFQGRVDEAFQPIVDEVPALLQATSTLGESAPATDLTGEVTRILDRFVVARDAVLAVEPVDEAPLAAGLYAASADLYVEVARLYLVAVTPAADPLRAQLALSARRLRILGDRVYDRAREPLEPEPEQSEDVVIRRPPEVPDWVGEGLAAGPPLAGPPPPASEVPPEREATRPEEPERDWLKRVRGLDLPSTAELARGVTVGDADTLGALAGRYLEGAATLRAAPDPAGGRERGARFGLVLLLHAESARLAQAAVVLSVPDLSSRLERVALRVAAAAEDLTDDDLRGPASGIDRGPLSGGAP